MDSTGYYTDKLDFAKMERLYKKRLHIMNVLMHFYETFRGTDELSTRALRYHNGISPKGHGKKMYVTFDDNSETYDVATDREILATLLKNYREKVTDPLYVSSTRPSTSSSMAITRNMPITFTISHD